MNKEHSYEPYRIYGQNLEAVLMDDERVVPTATTLAYMFNERGEFAQEAKAGGLEIREGVLSKKGMRYIDEQIIEYASKVFDDELALRRGPNKHADITPDSLQGLARDIMENLNPNLCNQGIMVKKIAFIEAALIYYHGDLDYKTELNIGETLDKIAASSVRMKELADDRERFSKSAKCREWLSKSHKASSQKMLDVLLRRNGTTEFPSSTNPVKLPPLPISIGG